MTATDTTPKKRRYRKPRARLPRECLLLEKLIARFGTGPDGWTRPLQRTEIFKFLTPREDLLNATSFRTRILPDWLARGLARLSRTDLQVPHVAVRRMTDSEIQSRMERLKKVFAEKVLAYEQNRTSTAYQLLTHLKLELTALENDWLSRQAEKLRATEPK